MGLTTSGRAGVAGAAEVEALSHPASAASAAHTIAKQVSLIMASSVVCCLCEGKLLVWRYRDVVVVDLALVRRHQRLAVQPRRAVQVRLVILELDLPRGRL